MLCHCKSFMIMTVILRCFIRMVRVVMASLTVVYLYLSLDIPTLVGALKLLWSEMNAPSDKLKTKARSTHD